MVMASKTFYNDDQIQKDTKYHKMRKEHNKISHLVCSTPTHTIHKKIAFEESNNLGSPISKNARKSEFTNTEYGALSPFPLKTRLPVKRMKVYHSDDDSNTQEANTKTKRRKTQKVEEKTKTDNNNISDSPSRNTNTTGKTSSKNDSLINSEDYNIIPTTDENEKIRKQTVSVENNKNKKNSSNKTKSSTITNVKRLRDQDSDEDTSILSIKTNLKSNKKIKQMINTENKIEDNETDDSIFSHKKNKGTEKKSDKNTNTKLVTKANKTSSEDTSIPRSTRTRKSISKSMNKSAISQWIEESNHYDSDDGVSSRDMSVKSRKKSKPNTKKEIINKDDDDNATKKPKAILKNSQENNEKPIPNADKSKMTTIRKSTRVPKPREAFWKKLSTLSYNLDKNTNVILPDKIKQNINSSYYALERNMKPINKKSNKNIDSQKLLVNIEIENIPPLSDSNKNTTDNNKSKKILPNKSKSIKVNKTLNTSIISKNKKLNTKETEDENKENVEKISKKKNIYSTENKKNEIENNSSHQNIDEKIKIDKRKLKNNSYLEKPDIKSKEFIEIFSPKNKENVNEKISKKKNVYSTENKKNEIENNSSHRNIDDKIKIDERKTKNNSYIEKPIRKSKKLIDMQNKNTKNLQSNEVEESLPTLPNDNKKVISINTTTNENSELNAKNSNLPNKLSSSSDKISTSNDNKNSKTTKSLVKRKRNNKQMKKIDMDKFKKSDLRFETSFISSDETDSTDESDNTDHFSRNKIPVRKSKLKAKSQITRKVTGNKPVKKTKYKALSELTNNSLSSNKPKRVKMNNLSNESTSDSDSLRYKNVRKYSRKCKIYDHCLKFKKKALYEQLPIPRKQGFANIMIEGHPVLLECFGNFPQEIYKTKEQPHLSIGKCLENNFCTVGIMEIKPQHTKSWVCALRNHIYFIILDGIAEVGIENMSRIMRIGDNFFVPKKSFYYISNVDTEKKLLINFVKIKCDED